MWDMGRWEPNARGRLARAALVLSAEKGYEATTVAEIAAAAGVTERTFYRYFPDKADALFPDSTQLLAHLAGVVTESVNDGHDAREATLAALQELATVVTEEPERALLGAQVIPAVPTLAGRHLVRQYEIADAISRALVEAGAAPLEAELAAEGALGVWRVALGQWVREPGRPLSEVLTATAEAAQRLRRG